MNIDGERHGHRPGPPASADPPDDRLIGRQELASRLDLDTRTVTRMVERGELPPPCIGEGGRPRWLWSYVISFCRKRHEQQAKIRNRIKTKLT